MSETATTIVLIGFLVVTGVVVPICGVSEKIREVISLRWLVIVTILALTLGAAIDFDHLDDASRMAVIIGGMVIGGLFVLLRTYEKCKAKGWSFGVKRIEGDWEHKRVEVELDDHVQKTSQSQSQEHTQEHTQSQENEPEKSEDKRDAI